MGTKVQFENYLSGHYSMRDPSHESNGGGWPFYYGDNNFPNAHYYYGFLPGYDKDTVKQTMLEHEAIFKNQVCELHRLYRVQRDLMDEVRRKDQFKQRVPYETSSSSSPAPSHMHSDGVQKWTSPSFPSSNCVSIRPPVSGPNNFQYSYAAKGKGVQASAISFQNCCSPKESEMSESRPSKSRRKMLDLQLPADEYIDTDEVEQFRDAKMSDVSSQSDKNGKFGPTNGPRLDFSSSKSNRLADLNEPVQDEETRAIPSAEFSGYAGSHREIQDRNASGKFLCMHKDALQNFGHGSVNGMMDKVQFEDRRNGQEWFSYSLRAGQSSSSPRSIQKSPLLEPACQIQSSLDNHIKVDSWRPKINGAMKTLERSYSASSHNNPDAPSVPHFPSYSSSSFGKPCSFVNQTPLSVQTNPILSSSMLNKSPQSSAQSNDFLSNKWNLNRISGYGTEPLGRNGFYLVSSSTGYDYATWSNKDEAHLFNANHFKGKTCLDLNSTQDINLDEGLSITEIKRKEDPPADTSGGTSQCPGNKKILGVPIFEQHSLLNKESSNLVSPGINGLRSGKEEIKKNGTKRLLDINVACDAVEDDEVAVLEKKMESQSINVRSYIDLNLCITEEEVPCTKHGTGIDLEAPAVLEDEEIEVPVDKPSNDQQEKQSSEPAQDKAQNPTDESARSAAEAIVTISSLSSESSSSDPLVWFVDVACAHGHDVESQLNADSNEKISRVKRDCLSDDLDDFESMTLKLLECSADEYFSQPSAFRVPTLDGNGRTVTRTRRGPARRGRQKRDFQRDILPGLASLSRHEVTEDLQMFGGLMRAIGHPWKSGTNKRNTTRNGCIRGRRRSVAAAPPPIKEQAHCNSNKTETGLEDRSLTGWGKTTRRPRRQRCHAGNPPPPVSLY